MKSSYVFDIEKKIEQLRIEVAKEWALENGMDISNIDNEDLIAIYCMLIFKIKYKENV